MLIALREGAGYRKEILTCFCPLFCISCFTEKLRRRARATWNYVSRFPFFVSSFEHVKLARVDDLDDGMTWTFTCCIL